MAFGRKEAMDLDEEELGKSMSDILRDASITRLTAVPPRSDPGPTAPQRLPAIWNAASWLRSLIYEDMMQAAAEMDAIRGQDSIDTPEKIAKLIHAWAKAVTDTEIKSS